jgi:Na+-transporting NADH:ubiquinone oxidoreductase subunit B
MSLRTFLDRIEPNFHPWREVSKLLRTTKRSIRFFTHRATTKSTAHVRDGIDLKRIMITMWMCTFPSHVRRRVFLGTKCF